jgi:N-formylglutamate amidohydrolase
VLDKPLLRPASGSTPPRVCYVYGIMFGPRKLNVTADTPRTCVDLARTPAAMSLTTGYDEGRTGFDLQLAGHNLTRKGLPVKPGATGVRGLTVARAYRLPDSQARIGAQEVE